MTNLIARLGELGIIPVVRLEEPAAKVSVWPRRYSPAACPGAEITFRTAAAAEGIRRVCQQSPSSSWERAP